MDDKQIRRIVQDEMRRGASKSRFGLQMPQNHAHTGIDGSPQIKQSDVVPSTSVTGFISFADTTTYTINLNASFTPRQILAYGIVTGEYSANQTRIMSIGTAQLTPTFYLQAETTRSVVTGNLQYPFQGKPAQSSSYINVTRGGTANFFAGVSEDHLLSVAFPTTANILARVTVTDFSKTAITLDVPYLESGWEITLNFVIS